MTVQLFSDLFCMFKVVEEKNGQVFIRKRLQIKLDILSLMILNKKNLIFRITNKSIVIPVGLQ